MNKEKSLENVAVVERERERERERESISLLKYAQKLLARNSSLLNVSKNVNKRQENIEIY